MGHLMRYFNWLLGTALFLALLALAIKNDQVVTLRYLFGFEWHTSLVLALLLFFTAGAACGTLAMFIGLIRQRREIVRLNKTIRDAAIARPTQE